MGGPSRRETKYVFRDRRGAVSRKHLKVCVANQPDQMIPVTHLQGLLDLCSMSLRRRWQSTVKI